jgi:DNA transformation protein and related proteins
MGHIVAMNRPAFVEHCTELLAASGAVRTGRMFSGHGFYVEGVFLALAIDDRLYLKSDAGTRMQLAAAGCEPFAYDGPRGTVTTSYWSAPAEAMESPQQMLPWARMAMQAALAARAPRARPLMPRAATTPATRTAASKGPTKKRAPRRAG